MSMRRLSQMKQRLPSAEAHYLGFFGATALNLTWTGLDMRGRPRLPSLVTSRYSGVARFLPKRDRETETRAETHLYRLVGFV